MSELSFEDWTGSVQDALAQLESEGFVLYREPSDADLPSELRGLRPDFVGRRGDDLVVVEVSTRGEARQAQLERLAEVVDRHPMWRLILLWAGEDVPSVPTEDVVGRWLDVARQTAVISSDAALLTVWVAVEAALERLVARQGISDIRGPASRLIAELFSLGVLSDRQYELLIEGQKTRGSVAHGRSVDVRPDLVSQLASLAEWLASEAFASTDEMVEHLLSAYEEHAQHVPHDSAEGGYRYSAGGPYDAREIVSE